MTFLWKFFRALHRTALPGPWNRMAMRCWFRTPEGAEWLARAREDARIALGRQRP
jgi:hypothetical protein